MCTNTIIEKKKIKSLLRYKSTAHISEEIDQNQMNHKISQMWNIYVWKH